MLNISLEPTDDGYVLKRELADGSTQDMPLTNEDVMALGQAASRMIQAALEAQNSARPGLNQVVAVPVAQVSLNIDHHRSEVLLGLVTPDALQATFAVPIDTVRHLARRLPSLLDEMDRYPKPGLQ